MASETTTTSIVEITNSEFITPDILDAAREPTIMSSVAAIYNAAGTNSAKYTIAQWTSAPVPVSEASPKSEASAFSNTEQLLTEVSVDAAVVGIRKEMTFEAQQDSIVPLGPALLRESVLEMRDQMDEDWLTNFTSATNTHTATTVLTLTEWGSALGKFRKQNPLGRRMAAVLHPDQVIDLKASMRSTSGAIFGGALGQQAGAGLFSGQPRGFLGVYEGVEFYETGNVPQFDANNWSGALLSAGDGGAIAFVQWTPMMETRLQVVELLDRLVVWKRYGTKITNNDSLLEIVSDKAA